MSPSFQDLWRVFGRIGLLSFGGPAAQIALMHQELVEKRPWLSEKQFLGALSFCMLLPGPEAMQLATYAGWKLRGTWGGLLAGLLFVIPGALVILALAMLYISYGTLPIVQAGFVGIKAAVVVVVLQALRKVAGKALTSMMGWTLAAIAFVCIYVFQIPFPVIIAVAAAIGWWTSKQSDAPTLEVPETGNPLRPLAIWLLLWVAPIALVLVIDQAFLTDIGFFFSKLAVVTFGGAYAVLAYMTQTVSFEFGWISPGEMIDALGLAETTPGPLILVTEFVALLAGYKEGGIALMLCAGALALWCTFVPCFLWIFTAAPYVERILCLPRLKGALDAITAAVVGVILNLSLWFALHVLFARSFDSGYGLFPVLGSFDPKAFALLYLAAALLLWRRMSLPTVLLICAASGILFSYL
ncbi:chromate efflux transporter [Cognatishimia activa]|uniref:Putative chromate transport protein n=1 Tax=Cognatishimia activa TaxID=1715691 RepID=A0A0P1IUF1_9RHOB|nr:chromate efflux transporter [Cognatishimia activa]CUJ29147.1 putative chromate transport protein [Cognatishimia activa]CUK27247.1 putative chromate transport protein [Cognatishimia activa]